MSFEFYYQSTLTVTQGFQMFLKNSYFKYESFCAKHFRYKIPQNFPRKLSFSHKVYICGRSQATFQKLIALDNVILKEAAPYPVTKEKFIPFVTYYCSHYATKGIVRKQFC